MEKSEQKLTPDDIRKIKSKRSQSSIAFLIAFIFFGLIAYVMKPSTPILLQGFVYFFFALSAYGIFHKFYKNREGEDLKKETKIVTKVKVLEKNITKRGGGKNRKLLYELKFDGSTDLKKYTVNKNLYDKISIGDYIDVEYSKMTLQVLKLEVNS